MNRNAKIVVEIYGNICPVFIWINKMKIVLSKNDAFKNEIFFKLLKEMRNMASHLNIKDDTNIQKLFINMVLIYKKFEIDLIDKFENIREIWNELNEDRLIDCSSYKLGNKSIDYDNISISNQHTYRDHYDLLKDILVKYFTNDNNLLTFIYKFGSPIIIWNEIIKKEKDVDIKNSKLFILTNEIKNKLCHYSINKESEILKSMIVIYQSFGLDLETYNSEISNINFNNIRLIGNHNEDDIKTDIWNIISDKNNKSRTFYFSFGTLLHHIVARNLLKNNSILRMFENRENIIERGNYHGSLATNLLVAYTDGENPTVNLSAGLELHFTDETYLIYAITLIFGIVLIFTIAYVKFR